MESFRIISAKLEPLRIKYFRRNLSKNIFSKTRIFQIGIFLKESFRRNHSKGIIQKESFRSNSLNLNDSSWVVSLFFKDSFGNIHSERFFLKDSF
jgi:hypothetical protein